MVIIMAIQKNTVDVLKDGSHSEKEWIFSKTVVIQNNSELFEVFRNTMDVQGHC